MDHTGEKNFQKGEKTLQKTRTPKPIDFIMQIKYESKLCVLLRVKIKLC